MLWLSAISLLMPVAAGAREQTLASYAYSADVPESFKGSGDVRGGSAAWVHESGDGIFQVLFLPAGDNFDAQSLFASVAGNLKARGDSEPYTYEGRDAVFGDMLFIAAGTEVHGYIIAINQDSGYDVVLLGYTPTASYDKLQPGLQSCIDSFSIDETAASRPGPVSQFYYPFPGQKKRNYTIPLSGRSLKVSIDPGEVECAQVLIEREAHVLAEAANAPQELRDEAWRRYYRMIYRDNLMRLFPLVEQIDAVPAVRQMDSKEFSVFLLDWIQGYKYSRTGSFADFLSPLEAALAMEGDCDSRGLLYVMLLHFFDIDAMLMVSSVYSHSMAAVDVPGAGARFSYNGKQYLVAETTEQVDMGKIDTAMADPAGWVGLGFRTR